MLRHGESSSRVFNLLTGSRNLKIAGDPQRIVASRLSNDYIFALYERAIYKIKHGVIEKEDSKLNYEARSFDVNETENEIYVGDYVKLFLITFLGRSYSRL